MRGCVPNPLEPFAGKTGAGGQACQFGIGDFRINSAKTRKGAKAAIRAGNHPVSTNDIHKPINPLRNQFRVFNKIGCGIHNAGH